jgi:3-carboxy-cis,cis-muconate cycloisomerase
MTPDSVSERGRLFGALSGSPDVDRQVSDTAWLQAMLDVEAALARAGARAGLVPPSAAAEIAAICDAERYDSGELGRRAVASGNPVVPLVASMEALLAPTALPYLHRGATSQDVVDTATALVAHRALGVILGHLRSVGERCAVLAARHRDAVMPGRTLMQHALPTTFGARCAGWLVAVDESRLRLRGLRDGRLAVQLGGAVGTLASLGPAGLAVLSHLAEELGLREPVVPWHTDRSRVAELAAELGIVVGALGKIGVDVTLLAQTEIGEVQEGGGDEAGGSSTLPQKHNPVRAVLLVAAARRTPGLVATVLAAMPQEHERAAGGWHAEWEPITDLLRITGGAAGNADMLLATLRVDVGRMRANVDISGGAIMAESVAGRLVPALSWSAARVLVAECVRESVHSGATLSDTLLADPNIRAHLDADAVRGALDPGQYLGSAGRFVDRALAAHDACDSSERAVRAPPG